MGSIICARAVVQDGYNPATFAGNQAPIYIQPLTSCVNDTAFIRYARPDGGVEGVFGFVQTQYGAATADFVIQGSSCGYSEKLRIAGNYVGIGISTPCSTLDVYKVGSGAGASGDNLILRGGNNNNGFGTNQIRFGYSGGIGYSHAIKSRHNSSVNTQNALDFFLWTTSDATETVGSKNVMTLESTGRMGINNCSPQFALHVNSTTTGDGLVVENTLRNIACFKSTGEHAFMYLDSAHQCIYQPAIFFMRAGTLYAENRLQRASSSDTLGSYTESEGVIGSTGNTPFSIQSCGVRRMYLTSSGKVGIGNISPVAKLSVYTTSPHSSATGLSVAADAGGTNLLARDTCYHNWFPYNDNNNYYSAEAHVFRNGNHSTTWMQITSAGNVGIGCATPRNTLEIIGVTSSPALCATNCDVMKIAGISNSSLSIGSTVVAPYSMWMQVKHQASDNLTYPLSLQTCGGNVGIGILNPGSYKLYVNGSFYSAGSSCEYKTQICNYNTDSCLFMKLKPVTYQYKDEYCHLGKELKSGTQIGLIAEDTAEVFPELAILKEEENEKVVRNVDYEKLTIILLSELQKLRQEVDQLKNK